MIRIKIKVRISTRIRIINLNYKSDNLPANQRIVYYKKLYHKYFLLFLSLNTFEIINFILINLN